MAAGSFLLILFGGASFIGGIVKWIWFLTSSSPIEIKQAGVLSFFLFTHFLVCIAGFYTLFSFLSLWLLCLINVSALVSRFLNGRILYRKTHWQHYLVSGGLLITASFLISLP